MKKKIVVSICISALLAVIAFCYMQFTGGPFDAVKKTGSTSPQTQSNGTTPKEEKKDVNGEGEEYEDIVSEKNTLLIYMLGSDLESRSGAGTSDLTEMVNSGIDLEKSNVLVYTGGSQKWHNNLVSHETCSIIRLTNTGFITESTLPSASMGTPESLTEFLTYGYENYPAENYALILWNHGNGPLIGYGKDMLFDNDSLTLSEMQSALSASPFNSSNKLSWVGFDACLMSSAELACVWSEYANYLVASQEIEPSFGWNYDMLKNYGSVDTKTFLSNLIDTYISTCEAYYDERGYENRDTTLSCMDLSYAPSLKEAIDALFAKASSEVNTKYNTLAKKRVETRALGRASTGSEYDLIDLADMATQLESVYPDEAKNIKDIVQNMVIKNGTNADLCCGMSIYYPFYNKYYFENSWRDIYSDLGVFANYGSYLDKYQTIWLNDESLDRYESSPTPQKVEDETNRSNTISGTYKLNLSPSQIEYYADAKYYILQKAKGELYHPVFSSEQVTYANGILYADFSGKGIHVKNQFGLRVLPVTIERDNTENISHYTVLAAGNIHTPDSKPIEFRLNLENEDLSTGAIVEGKSNSNQNELTGGKLKEYRLEDWDSYSFYRNSYMYLTRYDNGLVKPLSQWTAQGAFSYHNFPLRNGLEFVYESLSKDSYYIVFEITDTRGDKYCSELLPIDGEDYYIPETVIPEININWTDGEKVKLVTSENVSVYLSGIVNSQGEPGYVLEAENTNDFPISVHFSKITTNGNNTDLGTMSIYVDARATARETYNGIPAKTDVLIGNIKDISSLQGILEIAETVHYGVLMPETKINIVLSEETKFSNFSDYYEPLETAEPFLGALADEQIFYEDDEVRMTLLKFGKNNAYANPGYVCFENLSSQIKTVEIDAYSVNGITLNQYNSLLLQPHTKRYALLSSASTDFGRNKISQIESLMFHVAIYEGHDGMFEVPYISKWVPITLKEHGTAPQYSESGKLVFSNNSVRMYITSFNMSGASPTWHATIINDSDTDMAFNTAGTDYVTIDEVAGAHQRTDMEIKYIGYIDGKTLENNTLPLNIQFMDFYKSKTLFQTANPIILTDEEIKEEKQTKSISWSDGEPVELFSENGVNIILKKEEVPNTIVTIDENGEYSFENYTYMAYTVEAENSNSFDADITFDKFVVNDNIQFATPTHFTVKAGEKKSANFIYPSAEVSLGVLDTVEELKCLLTVKNSQVYNYYLAENLEMEILFSADSVIEMSEMFPKNEELIVEPYLDAMATEQTLWETDEFRISLMFFGSNNANYSKAYVRYENFSTETLTLQAIAGSINTVAQSLSSSATVRPGCIQYKPLSIFLQDSRVQSIESIDVFWIVQKEPVRSFEFYDSNWVSIDLCKKGKAPVFIPGEDIVYDRNGIRIILDEVITENSSPVWIVTVINDNDYAVDIRSAPDFGGAILYTETLGPGHRQQTTISQADNLSVESISLKVQAQEPFTYDTIFTDEDPITLHADN